MYGGVELGYGGRKRNAIYLQTEPIEADALALVPADDHAGN